MRLRQWRHREVPTLLIMSCAGVHTCPISGMVGIADELGGWGDERGGDGIGGDIHTGIRRT